MPETADHIESQHTLPIDGARASASAHADAPRRLRVLISAYACEPGKGSEPGIGWSIAREAARHHDVWVLTRANNRARIESELGREPVPSLHLVYFDLPAWARWWKRGALGTQLYYHLWQLGVLPVARRLHDEIGFDVTQHATFGRYWVPSLIARLPVPFVWGPVGGGESGPRELWRDGGVRGFAGELVRATARWFGEHDPLVRATARRASLALAVTEETAERLRALGARDVTLYSAMGLRRDEMAELLALPEAPESPTRFVSIGRMLSWKGFHTGLRAFAAAQISGAEYWLVGDGPALPYLRKLADRLGIRDRVRFCGAVPRSDALAILARSHALLHPSLHDSGGWVCLEAMAAGRPVICLRLGGPAEMVTPETGILISSRTRADVESDLTRALVRIAGDEALRRRLGAAARVRAQERYIWEAKGDRLARLYDALATT